MSHAAFSSLTDRAAHVLGQLQHFNQICKLFHGKRIVVDTKVGEEQTGFLFFGATLIVHGGIHVGDLHIRNATEPEDRLRQCVFGGTSNALDFLPLDRSGNRRFLPVMVHPEQAEVHIQEDEAASRQYMDQLWAEDMTLDRRGKIPLKVSKEMNEQLVLLQKQFMPEDTKAGVIQAFLDDFDGDMVCSKLLHHEALGRFDEPKSWEIREINEIMNQSVTGGMPYPNPRSYKTYGKQRGWMRGNEVLETGTSPLNGFCELTEEECSQMELPF